MTADRVVALEEHVVTPAVLAAWQRLAPQWQDLALAPSAHGRTGRALLETGPERIAAMDASGVDMQVLSLSTPGVQNLAVADAAVLQREANDAIAEVVRATPDRFQGLATLATPAPQRAAEELRRAVTVLGLDGAMLFPRTRDRWLDEQEFWPVFEAAADLHAPLYLHPQSPPAEVRSAYYSGFGPAIDSALATHGVGWHYDAGVAVLRLILGGVFDRFPSLQVIVGHWGEMLLFFLDRIAQLGATADLPHDLDHYVRQNLLVTPSGIFSERYLRWAVEVIGADRILFATDYPFVDAPARIGRTFATSAGLDEDDAALVGSGNWERLRSAVRR